MQHVLIFIKMGCHVLIIPAVFSVPRTRGVEGPAEDPDGDRARRGGLHERHQRQPLHRLRLQGPRDGAHPLLDPPRAKRQWEPPGLRGHGGHRQHPLHPVTVLDGKFGRCLSGIGGGTCTLVSAVRSNLIGDLINFCLNLGG